MEDRLSALENNGPSSSANDDNWKAALSRDVFEHDHGIVVHGFRLQGADSQSKISAATRFLTQELKASTELVNKVKIKEVVVLGSDNGIGKPPPFIIKFSHPTERNQILPLSSNLKKGIDLDKNIPKKYKAKHKEFKRLAWKLRLVYGVQAQVIFDDFKLVLRYKKKDEGVDKYNYIIEKEWFPKPGEGSATQSVSINDPSKLVTPVIDTSALAACHRTTIVTGLPDVINQGNVSTEVGKIMEESDAELIEEIEFKSKGTSLVVCKDWESCRALSEKYNKSKLLGSEIGFTMFSENNPSTFL